MRIFWALAVCSLAILVSSSNSYPQPQTKSENKPTTQDKRGTQEAPLIIQGDITTKTAEKPESERKQEEEKIEIERSIAKYTGWAAGVTLLLVLVTGFLAIYTYKLWKSTNTLAEDAKNAATQQAADTQKSLAIARQSANTAATTVAVMEKNARKELRAYLMVDCVELVDVKPDASRDFYETWIHVRYKNFGQLPATKIKYWSDIGKHEFPLSGDLVGQKVMQWTGPVAPHDTFTAKMKLELMDSADEHDALYIQGEIHYIDGFQDRWTKMFYMRRGGENWLKEGEMEVYPQGNDII